MDLMKLDRAVVFLEGILFYWICEVVFKEVIPDIKRWIQELKKDSADGTAERYKNLYF